MHDAKSETEKSNREPPTRPTAYFLILLLLLVVLALKLGADHLIRGGGVMVFCEEKIVQQIIENK